MSEYIKNCLIAILQAVYGRDVRKAIHDAIAYCIDEIEIFRTEYEALKAGWISDWNDTVGLFRESIDALHYVNDKTGVVVLTGADIKMDMNDENSKTLSECLTKTASDVRTSKIEGTSDDFSLDITYGGLV